MAGKYGRLIPEAGYEDSALKKYLRREDWDAQDGILLLSGLSPEGTDIAREGPYALQPLDAAKEFSAVSRWFYAMERKLTIEMEPLGEILDKKITKKDEEEIRADMRKACEELLGNFEENEDVWKYSRSHHNGSPGDMFPQSHLLKWAKDKKIDVPWRKWAEKEGYIEKEDPPGFNQDGTESGLPFMDEKHRFFSSELKIAVEAWMDLYEKNPPKKTPAGGHKKYIEGWLGEKCSKLTSRAKDRISTIINPNPKGGVPPTDY